MQDRTVVHTEIENVCSFVPYAGGVPANQTIHTLHITPNSFYKQSRVDTLDWQTFATSSAVTRGPQMEVAPTSIEAGRPLRVLEYGYSLIVNINGDYYKIPANSGLLPT